MSLNDQLQQALAANSTVSKYFKDDQEISNLVRGVPLTGMLPLQAVTRINSIPIGRFMTIAGDPNTGKSNLGWEICRIWRDYGGIIIYIGTEPKENVRTQKRLLHIRQSDPMTGVQYFKNVNTQDELKTILNEINDLIIENDPQGKVPVLIFIDSLAPLTSTKPRSEMTPKEKKKADETNNNMAAAHRAKNWKAILMDFQLNYVNERPLSIMGVNHFHKGVSTNGMPAKSSDPGGRYIEYLNSWRLFLRRTDTNSVNSSNSSFGVEIKNTKQSSGSERDIKITPRFKDWTVELEEGEETKVCGFNWDEALIKLLLSDYTNNSKLKEIMDLKKEGQMVSSETLGCEKVSQSEMGKAIHENEEIYNKILDMFDVYECPLFPEPE